MTRPLLYKLLRLRSNSVHRPSFMDPPLHLLDMLFQIADLRYNLWIDQFDFARRAIVVQCGHERGDNVFPACISVG
jgi:hypothetical protein